MLEKKMTPKLKRVYKYLLSLFNNESTVSTNPIPSEAEIAEKLGVSRPTVAKAINLFVEEGKAYRKSGVGTFFKAPNNNQRYKIGLVFPLIGKGEIFNPITQELANLSNSFNISLVWGGQFNGTDITNSQMEQMIDFYIEQKVDGILFAPVELTQNAFALNKKIIKKIESVNIPIVLVDAEYYNFPKRSKYDLVGIDNFKAGYISAQHFIQQGVKRIDFLHKPFMAQTIPHRIMGYRQALCDAGICPSLEWTHCIEEINGDSVLSIIETGAKNIICANDDIALRLIKSLSENDIAIPKDIRVSGFDNIESARYQTVSLSTIAQPCKKLAYSMLDTMMSRIKTPNLPARNVLLDIHLKERKSSLIEKNNI